MKIRGKFLMVAGCVLILAGSMRADDISDLKAEIAALRQKLNDVEQQLLKVTEEHQQPAAPAADSSLYTGTLRSGDTKRFFERKPGDSLTFYTGGGGNGTEKGPGEMTVYGNFDVSFDVATKGLQGKLGPDGMPPVGNMSWLPDISTNNTYIGIRGIMPVTTMPFDIVYQFETSIDVASTSGTGETNSSESNTVKGALTSRNTFVGITSPRWGSLKFGKTFTPYMSSTTRMDSFYGTIADYQAIMGNTGGDNRIEFGTRLDHSIWYESPVWSGFSFNALFSPGQNRASNSDNLAAGESDCTGGNIPGSGGITPITCSDGAFSNAVSASASYSAGPVYLVAAYERHMKVNRESDITGLYATCGATCTALELQDVADEDAGKVAAQFKLTPGTIVSGIFETLHRYVPEDLEFQNERQRNGTWGSIDQKLSKNTTLSLGWAHAFRTPGDPGQHNDSYNTPPGGIPGVDAVGGAHQNNQANLFSAALRYKASRTVGFYLAWGYTANGPSAHYDLGAGSRSVQTDCHDASDATGGLVGSNPHCWTGGQLDGASLGMNWKF